MAGYPKSLDADGNVESDPAVDGDGYISYRVDVEDGGEYTVSLTAKSETAIDSPVATYTFTASPQTGVNEAMVGVSGLRMEGTMIRNLNNARMYIYSAAGQLMTVTTEDFDAARLVSGVYVIRCGNDSYKLVK